MSNTREKLREAEYFLERVRENQPDREAFKYTLSAFLSAARSVTFFMQKEFKRTLGFEAWYEIEQDKMKSDPVMKFFLDARNVTLKQEHVPTRAQVAVGMSVEISSSVSLSIQVVRADGTKEVVRSEPASPTGGTKAAETEATVEWRWYFEDPPRGVVEKDVVTLCEEHVAKLDTLIAECESKFHV